MRRDTWSSNQFSAVVGSWLEVEQLRIVANTDLFTTFNQSTNQPLIFEVLGVCSLCEAPLFHRESSIGGGVVYAVGWLNGWNGPDSLQTLASGGVVLPTNFQPLVGKGLHRPPLTPPRPSPGAKQPRTDGGPGCGFGQRSG